MATVLQSSSLRFSLTFKKATLKVRFTDLLSALYYPMYGQAVANLKGLVNVVGSVSGVVYQNDGWATSDYSAPDIDGNAGTWYFEFDLPTDASGEVIAQEFTVYFKLTNGTLTWNTSKSYTYDYESPTVQVEVTHNCKTAIMYSKDTTGTDYLFQGVIPSIDRTHLITEPSGTTRTPAGSVVTHNTLTDERILGGTSDPATSLWSGQWQTLITSALSYNLDTWGDDVWIIITDTVKGYNTHNVQCSDCACVLNQCVDNFFDYVLGKRNTDPAAFANLWPKALEVAMRYVQFFSAERCGEDYDEFCTDIQEIVKGTDCFCLQDLSTAPMPIYPTSSSVIYIGGGGAAFNFILIDHKPPVGTSWDWAIEWDGLTTPENSTYYYLWQQVAGAPYFVGDLKGPKGKDGTDGSNGVGVDQSILWNDIGAKGSPAGTSETDLKTYTIPSNLLAHNGEQLEIDAAGSFALNDNGKTVRLYFAGNTLYEYFTDSLLVTGDDKWRLNAVVNRLSAAAQYILAKAERGNKMYSPKETELTVDLTAPIQVKVTGQNSVATANDIVVKQLCLKYYGLVAGIPSFLVDYKFGVETLLAGVQKDVTFTTPFAATPYTLNLTAVDENGDTQQVTLIGSPTVSGFSVSCLVNATLSWSAFF